MTTITIEVDGKSLSAQAGEMLICVTDRNAIEIPRFCYHEKLSVAANCRMCLVEVEKASKPLPACATPVMDGMKVFTRSKYAREAQQGTMEFLLINHPLDCPVCDQGGECPLQDQAMGHGNDGSRFLERKRTVPSPDIGPLIATEMTRCIHCTRCVRFGDEIAGIMEMGAPGRGEFMTISTFLNRSIDSEVSGNMIDLCPVGALTSKPYRFAARPWELQNHPSISPHDCLGTNINIQTLRNRVERVLPIDNPEINECWLADRDRYSYEAVNSDQRLTQPMIKDGNEWREVDWESALNHAAAGINAVLNSGSGKDIGGLAAATSTLEEFYLLQKLMRSLGSDNVDHRLQQCDFRDDNIAPQFPASEVPIQQYNTRASVLLIGSNIRKEQPLLALRLRDGCNKKGTKISALNPINFEFNFATVESVVLSGGQMVHQLLALAVSIARLKSVASPTDDQAKIINEINYLPDNNETIHEIVMSETAQHIVDGGENALIIFGGIAQQHADASLLKLICHRICEISGCKLAVLPPANSVAGWIAGCVPADEGMNAAQMLGQISHRSDENSHAKLRAMILLATEPELDSMDGKSALQVLHNAEFVVQISAFKSASVMQYANVLLPMAAFAESAGTFINCEGRAQSAQVAVSPIGEARPAWKILRVLGNFLELTWFDYISLDDVSNEVNAQANDSDNNVDGLPTNRLKQVPSQWPTQWDVHDTESGSQKTDSDGLKHLKRLIDMPMYRGDITLRHAHALQQTADNPPPAATLNPAMIVKLNLSAGNRVVVCPLSDQFAQSATAQSSSITLPLRANNGIPDDCVYIPAGFMETINLGRHVVVTLRKEGDDTPQEPLDSASDKNKATTT